MTSAMRQLRACPRSRQGVFPSIPKFMAGWHTRQRNYWNKNVMWPSGCHCNFPMLMIRARQLHRSRIWGITDLTTASFDIVTYCEIKVASFLPKQECDRSADKRRKKNACKTVQAKWLPTGGNISAKEEQQGWREWEKTRQALTLTRQT